MRFAAFPSPFERDFLRGGVALVELAALERSFCSPHRVASRPLDAVTPDHRMISMTRRFGVKVGLLRQWIPVDRIQKISGTT